MTDFLSIPQHQLTLSGNTAGALAALSSGTVTIAGGNNITVSQAGNAITISGANAGGAQTAISGIANSETTYTSGTVSLSELGAITIRSTTGQQFQFSVNPQSVQPETQTFVGGISASDTLYTSGTVRFTGSQAITVRSGTGQLVVIDAPVQSVQPETQTFVGGISASDTLYTSGTVRFTGVGGGVTVSSNTGQRVDISVAAQSVQPETQTFVGGIGNSQTTYTSGTVNLSVVAGQLTIRSTTGQAFQFSASQSVQPETQTAISGIANSQTTYTSGTVSLSELGAITIRSTTGNQFQLSVNAQTTQTQGILSAGVSTGGNTAGNTTVNTGSRLVFVGTNMISLSQTTAAGATTISLNATQSVQPETQTAISGIANSQTTYTSGTVSLSELGAITIRSTTGNQFQFSVNAQTTQTQGILSAGVSNLGNTAGNTTVNTGSRLVIVGSNGITASQGTAAGATTITLSGITQSVQTNDIPRLGVSTGGNTAGDTTVNSGTRLVFVGTNNITLSQGTAASATTITISGPTTAAQSVQTQGILNVALSNIGNTAGDTGINSGTRMVLAGGNNVTLSASSAANATTVTISAANQTVQTQGILSAGVSTGGNTAGNTTVNTGSRLVYVGSNMISLSQTTAAGATTITFNATQTVQTQNLHNVTLSGNSTSAGAGYIQISSGTMTLAGGNNITLSQNGNAVTISAGAGGAETQTAISGIAASNTTYTSGSVTFTGVGGGVTVSSNTGQRVDISVAAPVAQTVQTQGILSAGVSTGGNTAGNTTVNTGSRMVFVGTNMVSLSQTTGAGATTISINATQSVQTQGILNVALSNIGNTSGDTGLNSGTRMVLAGGNNITLSASSAANATTITISAGGGAYSAGMSTNGNTSGDTGYASQRLNLVGGNNITLSGSTNGGSMTITVSAPNLGAGAMSAGVSNLGNTAGSTGITGTQLVLVGTNMISLSQSTGANGGTVSINATQSVQTQGVPLMGVSTGGATSGDTTVNSGTRFVLVGTNITMSQGTAANATTITVSAPATSSLSATGGIQISTNGSTISIGDGGRTMANWENMPAMQAALYTHISGVSKTPFYWPEFLPAGIQPANIAMRVSMVTANSDLSLSIHFGVYTFVNSTSAALLGSGSNAFVVSSGSSVSLSAQRNLILTSPGTNTAISSLSAGNYLFGVMFSATATNAMNASIYAASAAAGPRVGRIMPGTNQLSTATSQGIAGLYGRGSTTVNAMPANVVASEVVNQGIGASSPMKPYIFIRS